MAKNAKERNGAILAALAAQFFLPSATFHASTSFACRLHIDGLAVASNVLSLPEQFRLRCCGFFFGVIKQPNYVYVCATQNNNKATRVYFMCSTRPGTHMEAATQKTLTETKNPQNIILNVMFASTRIACLLSNANFQAENSDEWIHLGA